MQKLLAAALLLLTMASMTAAAQDQDSDNNELAVSRTHVHQRPEGTEYKLLRQHRALR